MRTTRKEVIKLSKGQINPHVLEEGATTLYGRVLEDAFTLHNIVEAIGKIEPMEDGYHPFLKQGFEGFRSRVNAIIKEGGGG